MAPTVPQRPRGDRLALRSEQLARGPDCPGALGAVAVIEGVGFWSAGVHSMLTGVCLLSRPPFPWRIVETADAGTRWLAERRPEPAGEAALRKAMATMATETGTSRAA